MAKRDDIALLQLEGMLDQKHSMLYLSKSRDLKKNVGVAYLLLIFLGGFGAHKFVIGRPGEGIFYLVGWLGGFIMLVLIPVLGFLMLFVVGMVCLVDLFTLPSQCRAIEAKERKTLLGDLLQHQSHGEAAVQHKAR